MQLILVSLVLLFAVVAGESQTVKYPSPYLSSPYKTKKQLSETWFLCTVITHAFVHPLIFLHALNCYHGIF